MPDKSKVFNNPYSFVYDDPTRTMTAAAPDNAVLMRIRTRQLLLVAQIAQVHNLGRAAAALGISQPAATKLLQQLESSLGASLFEREPRGMSPTPLGEAVVRFAQQVQTDFGAVREEMAALRAGLQGRLRLGSVPGALPGLVAPVLGDYKRAHPRVAVTLLVETSDVMLAQLDRGEVDLVLGRVTEGHHDEAFDSRPLLGEAQVVVVRSGHPLLRVRRALDWAELARWPWILQPPGSPQRARFEAAAREAGVQGRLDITETASTVATTTLLEHSDMAAVMPASLAGHYARLGVLRVLPAAPPFAVPPIHLITRRQRVLSPAALAFMQQVSAFAAPPADSAGVLTPLKG
jgi:DNA-binding transcriptional LysR family regulator